MKGKNSDRLKTNFEDYHILAIDNHELVSWKWDDMYVAASGKQGQVIAGMLPVN